MFEFIVLIGIATVLTILVSCMISKNKGEKYGFQTQEQIAILDLQTKAQIDKVKAETQDLIQNMYEDIHRALKATDIDVNEKYAIVQNAKIAVKKAQQNVLTKIDDMQKQYQLNKAQITSSQ